MSDTLDMEQLKSEVERLANLIDVPANLRPRFEMPPADYYDYGDFIVVKDGKYVYIRAEPQGAFEHFRTDSADELLYCVFECLTFDMAGILSQKEFVPNVEVRRFIWPKQLELMQRLSPSWRQRLANEISMILAQHPPRDGLGDIAK